LRAVLEESEPTRVETAEHEPEARAALWPDRALTPAPSARHCLDGTTPVPPSVLEALVETSWALPGLRASYARSIGRDRIRVVACAAPELLATTCGRVVTIDAHWAELLHDGETLVVGDALDEPISERARLALVGLGASAVCWAPLRATGEHGPTFAGLVALESSTPRAWTPTELAALERLVPLCELALERASMTSELQRVRARVAALQHRVDAMRGVSAAVLGEGGSIVRALESIAARPRSESDGGSLAALASLLDGVLGELALDVERARVPLDFAAMLRELEPALRALLGGDVELRCAADSPLWVRANRTLVARALVGVVLHAHEHRRHGRVIEIAAAIESGTVCVRITGDGLGADPALVRVSTHAPATVDDLGPRLWIARCALVSHGAVVEVVNDFDDGTSIMLALPPLG
jgi:hypothetical protein